jgi:hypothetical protein
MILPEVDMLVAVLPLHGGKQPGSPGGISIVRDRLGGARPPAGERTYQPEESTESGVVASGLFNRPMPGIRRPDKKLWPKVTDLSTRCQE